MKCKHKPTYIGKAVGRKIINLDLYWCKECGALQKNNRWIVPRTVSTRIISKKR
jgi:NMD protein affecting ribosome stability and mRNA decay